MAWLGLGVLLSTGLHISTASAQVAVTQYHNDNLKTGWNGAETQLTIKNVSGQQPGVSFGPIGTIPLDGVAFAQPLVVPNVVVTGDPNPGTHDVVYQATYNNSVYAIDPTRGTVLLTRNFGAPALDPCNVRGPTGIMGTPVIDTARNALYIIAHVTIAGAPQYVLHSLDLGTLADKVPPVVIAATAKLSDGSDYAFNPLTTRQRPALLEVNGGIYAGWGGSCDVSNPLSPGRGWMLGWSADTLALLPNAYLTDRDATEPNNYFHTAIWMSGAGLASDPGGNIYFITGNSDPSGTTYSRNYNITESVAKISTAKGRLVSSFTPQDYPHLDQIDLDFGSGGIVLLPSTAGTPPLAIGAGKQGAVYLMDRNNLGGYTPGGPDKVYGLYLLGHCLCSNAAFKASSGTYVVSGGGTSIVVLQVAAGSTPSLTQIAASPTLPNSALGQGYFPTVSSNRDSDQIIWVVARPVAGGNNQLQLVAVQALPAAGSTSLPVLYTGQAGDWSYQGGPAGANANASAVVANGHVYVASDNALTIFGLSKAAN